MKKIHLKTIKIASVIAMTLAVILAVFIMWLYNGNFGPFKEKVFTALPLPIASVNGVAIYLPNYTTRWQIYQRLYQNKLTSQSSETAKKLILNQIVKEEIIAQIAAQRGIYVTKNELVAEFLNQTSIMSPESKNNLSQFFVSYHLSQDGYQNYVLKPQFLTAKLKTWFNSQPELNQKQFTLAKNLVEQTKAGEDMSILAKLHNQEEVKKIIGGDMGFVDPTELLLEMREAVYLMSVGDVNIIPNREGINIIKLEEKQSNKFHLRQIFLTSENFDIWLEVQTKNYKIYKLINF